MPKVKAAPISPTEVRRILLRYLYNRYESARSSTGKYGSAIKISEIRRELKTQHQLTQQEVRSALNYMSSSRWIDEVQEQRSYASGKVFAPTTCYRISAAGIDQIKGKGEFTKPKYDRIKIKATGQSIVNLGDGNKIDNHSGDLGNPLVELRDAIAKSDSSEAEKLNLVADIDTIQSQLAKSQPNKSIIAEAWQVVRGAATIKGCSTLVEKVGRFIAGFIS